MKERLNENAVGLTFGSAAATLHALWVIAVGAGFGQTLADWWHSVHFLSDMHVVSGFSLGTAVLGILGAFVLSYVLGRFLAALWNLFSRK